jgi:hypothetical protein
LLRQDLSGTSGDNSSSSSSLGVPAPDAAAAATAAAAAAAGGGGEARLSGSHRHIAELLLEQIEVAGVLLLNKADTVSKEELALLQVCGGGGGCVCVFGGGGRGWVCGCV